MPGLAVVTQPAPVSDLTTLAAVHDTLGISPTDTSRDLTLLRLIHQASALIAKHCGRPFGLEGITETFRRRPGNGSIFSMNVAPYGTPLDGHQDPLILSRRPIIAVSSVIDATGPLTAGVDYELDPGAGLLNRLYGVGYTSWVSYPVVVSYTSGFDLANAIPADLESIALALVTSGWFALGRDPSIAMDMLAGDRTQFWDRSVSGMIVDDALAAQLADYVERVA